MNVTVSVEQREDACTGGDLDFGGGPQTSWEVCVEDGACQLDTGALPVGAEGVRDALLQLVCPDGDHVTVVVGTVHVLIV